MSLTPETGVLEKIDFWCKQNKYSLSPEEHGVTRDCMLRTIKYGAAGSLIGGIGFAALSRGRMMETKRMMWTIGSFGAGVLGWELGKMFAMRPNMRQMLSVSQSIIAQVTKEIMLSAEPRNRTHFVDVYGSELNAVVNVAVSSGPEAVPAPAADAGGAPQQ